MTEREAEAVETDYHATVNLIILLSYWLKEHPLSEVRAQVWELKDQLGQQLAHNIHELTGIADTELCEEGVEEAWQDFLRILKEHRETKEPDAEDEPEPEPETARGTLGADPSREEVLESSRGNPEPGGEARPSPQKGRDTPGAQAWSAEVAVLDKLAALEEWREVTDERVTLLEKETKSLRQDRSSRCLTLHHGEPRADGLWSALGVLDYADDPDEDEDAASGLRDVLERNDEIRCDTCGETILRRDDDAWSEEAAERVIGEHMDHCKPTDPPMGLQPGPPTEPGLYLVACEPPAFSSLGLDHAWAVCTVVEVDTPVLKCHHPGGSTEFPSEHVAGHLKLPKEAAEGLPLRMGWKAGPPPAAAAGTFAIKNHKGRCGLSRNNRRALAGSEEIERIVVVDAHTPSGATALWPVETVKRHVRLGD